MKTIVNSLALCAVLTASGAVQAALIDRGKGLIYDTDLNVTLLKDTNLSATNTFGVSGIDTGGRMTWVTALSWIAAMNTANYLGYNDWRLPATSPINGSVFDYNFSYNGSTDQGFNVSAPTTAYAGSAGSEMAHLFYNGLGNKGYFSTLAVGPQPGMGLSNTGPFLNLHSYYYWSGTVYAPDSNRVWDFSFSDGHQDNDSKTNNFYAFAVRTGDVAVPVPSAAWLLCCGLVGLMSVAQRKAK